MRIAPIRCRVAKVKMALLLLLAMALATSVSGCTTDLECAPTFPRRPARPLSLSSSPSSSSSGSFFPIAHAGWCSAGSLNGVCSSGSCACDKPWGGPSCGVLTYAPTTPISGKDLFPINRTSHNTWNGTDKNEVPPLCS